MSCLKSKQCGPVQNRIFFCSQNQSITNKIKVQFANPTFVGACIDFLVKLTSIFFRFDVMLSSLLLIRKLHIHKVLILSNHFFLNFFKKVLKNRKRRWCLDLKIYVTSVPWWWWCYPTPSEGWGRGGTPKTQQSCYAPRSGPEVNVSPPQCGGAVPALLSERWAEIARQLPVGPNHLVAPQSSLRYLRVTSIRLIPITISIVLVVWLPFTFW